MITEIIYQYKKQQELAFDIDHNLQSFINQINKEGIKLQSIICKHGNLDKLNYKQITHYLGEQLIIVLARDKYRPDHIHSTILVKEEFFHNIETIPLYNWKEISRDSKLNQLLKKP